LPYFNYSLHAPPAANASFWQRRAFVHAWWAIAQEDERWTPPRYGALRRELDPRRNDHLARLDAALLRVEALYRTGVRRSRTDQQEIPLTSVLERPLAAAVALIDPRRAGRAAHLGLLQLADDREAFNRLYYHLVETLTEAHIHRVVGPVGLSPYLSRGALVDSWDAWPPQHTPNNPPYLPEMLERRGRVGQVGRLYEVVVAEEAAGTAALQPGAVQAFDMGRLAGELLPLLIAAVDDGGGFAPPDALEAAYLLRTIGPGAFGGLAERDGAPVGFVWLAPDAAGRLRAARGGRPLWGRAALALAGGRPVCAGRLLFGGVLPAWRGRGVGSALWAWAVAEARARGWRTLTVGPIWSPRRASRVPAADTQPAAAAFLLARGAVARQTYQLYEWSF
jgi:GNAT superfamily N-acetyltransferase